jgi:copper(I)-binding protein
MREVKTFDIPAAGTLTLTPGGDHLMLLNLRQPLQQGGSFVCSLVFKVAGTATVSIQIAAGDATTAP